MKEIDEVLTEFADRILTDGMCGVPYLINTINRRITDANLQNEEIAKVVRELFDTSKDAKLLQVSFSPSFVRDGCEVKVVGGTITVSYAF